MNHFISLRAVQTARNTDFSKRISLIGLLQARKAIVDTRNIMYNSGLFSCVLHLHHCVYTQQNYSFYYWDDKAKMNQIQLSRVSICSQYYFIKLRIVIINVSVSETQVPENKLQSKEDLQVEAQILSSFIQNTFDLSIENYHSVQKSGTLTF